MMIELDFYVSSRNYRIYPFILYRRLMIVRVSSRLSFIEVEEERSCFFLSVCLEMYRLQAPRL